MTSPEKCHMEPCGTSELRKTAVAEPDQDRLRSRGRSMVGILGRVGTAATGGTIAQLLGHAMLTAMGLG